MEVDDVNRRRHPVQAATPRAARGRTQVILGIVTTIEEILRKVDKPCSSGAGRLGRKDDSGGWVNGPRTLANLSRKSGGRRTAEG
jgi:hypothetical protein